jgi:hypothetical protein
MEQGTSSGDPLRRRFFQAFRARLTSSTWISTEQPGDKAANSVFFSGSTTEYSGESFFFLETLMASAEDVLLDVGRVMADVVDGNKKDVIGTAKSRQMTTWSCVIIFL